MYTTTRSSLPILCVGIIRRRSRPRPAEQFPVYFSSPTPQSVHRIVNFPCHLNWFLRISFHSPFSLHRHLTLMVTIPGRSCSLPMPIIFSAIFLHLLFLVGLYIIIFLIVHSFLSVPALSLPHLIPVHCCRYRILQILALNFPCLAWCLSPLYHPVDFNWILSC